MAPKVSLKYWQTCIKNYLSFLDTCPSSDTTLLDPESEKINYLLLLNQIPQATALLTDRGETNYAKLVKSLSHVTPLFHDVIASHERVIAPG